MINESILISKNDIPFIEAQINIHQPTVSEVLLIGEEDFFSGCHFLNFNINSLSDKDKIGLEDKSDFEILMSIMCSKEQIRLCNSVKLVLALLFPTYQIKLLETDIVLFNEKHSTRINKENYNVFKDILVNMFLLNDSSTSADYNPADARAAKIAEKLKKAKDKINKGKQGEKQKVLVFSRYLSILSIGLKMDINVLLQYTVYQLKDAFARFQKQLEYDMYVKAKLAGAQNLDEVDNWMDDIHP